MSEPVTLSMAWGIDAENLDKAGVIDVTLNCDTNLFIDPLLLDEASDPDFRDCATKAYEQRFNQLIDLLVASKKEGDVAWRAAERHLSFHEVPFTHLGYSSGTGALVLVLSSVAICSWSPRRSLTSAWLTLICSWHWHCLRVGSGPIGSAT